MVTFALSILIRKRPRRSAHTVTSLTDLSRILLIVIIYYHLSLQLTRYSQFDLFLFCFDKLKNCFPF